MSKKASRGLSGSLGFRVLSISFLFLAIPLVVYSVALYFIDYRQHVRNIFDEIDLLAQEEIAWLHEKETYYANTMLLIEEFIRAFHLKEKDRAGTELNEIISQFTEKQDVAAILYVEANDNGDLIVKNSTVESYRGLNYGKLFTTQQLRDMPDDVFIAKDPLLGYSMFIVQYVDDRGKDAFVMAIVSLQEMLDKMIAFQKQKGLQISFLDKNGNVLASTQKEYEDRIFTSREGENVLTIKRINYVKNGKFFEYKGEKHFFDIRQIPKSETFLVFSIPEYEILARFQSLIYRLGFFLLAVVIIGGVLTFLFTLRMASPLKQLMKVMSTVGGGDLKASYKRDRYGFEINRLGNTFNKMTKNLVDHIEEVKKEKGMKEAFEKELQIGHQIQKALLPSHEEEIQGVDIATFYSPAKEVAGDFYEYGSLSEDQVLVCIADGVGKGISSCLYSFDFRSILKTASFDKQPLQNLVVKTNNIFCTDTKESCNFVTAVIGYIDKKARHFEFTNAGHLPVIVKRANGEIQMYSTKGIALGIEMLEGVEKETIPLSEGDYCVLYTDGVTEAQNGKDELFTEPRLIETVKNFSGNSSGELVSVIMDDVSKFVLDKEQYDDITLIVFKL